MSKFFTPAAPQTNQSVINNPSPSSIPADVDSNGNAQTTTAAQDTKNNTVESLVERLTTGGEVSNVTNSNQQQQLQPNNPQDNQQQTRHNDPTNPDTTQASSVEKMLEAFNAPFKGESLTAKFDIEKIAEGIRNGDLSELQGAVEETAQQSVNRASQVLLNLIPDIIDAAEKRVLERVNTDKSVDNLWTRFKGEHEGFEGARAVMEPMILNAVKNGANEQQAFEAVAMIYAGINKTANETKTNNSNPDPRDSASKTFDLEAFTKSN